MCYDIGFVFLYKGFRLLFQDAQEVRRIMTRMFSDSVEHQNVPYRDLEKLRQVGWRTEADIYGIYCCHKFY